MKNFKKLIKEAYLGNPLNEVDRATQADLYLSGEEEYPEFDINDVMDDLEDEEKDYSKMHNIELNARYKDKLGVRDTKGLTRDDLIRGLKFHEASIKMFDGKKFDELDIAQKQKLLSYMNRDAEKEFERRMAMREELLKEFTLPGGDYRDSYANRLPEEQLTTTDDYEVFMEMFPRGEASRILMNPNRKKLYDQHLEWTKDSQYNNVFVHMQYHEVEHEGELYKIHQTQYYNTNYDDFRSPRFTELMISKDGKRMGTYLVDTKEYVEDLKNLDIKKRVSESLNEDMGEWPKELKSRYSDEYRFELEKVTPTYKDKPGRAKYRVIDIESGELKGTPVFGKPESLMDFADDLIKPQGGTQSSHFGTNENINDPVLMRTRAAQMKRDAIDKKDLENKSKRISAEKAVDLRYELSILDKEREDILIRIEDLAVETDQTAEPEGGEKADDVGERMEIALKDLRDIDSKIIGIKDDLGIFDMNEDRFAGSDPRAGSTIRGTGFAKFKPTYGDLVKKYGKDLINFVIGIDDISEKEIEGIIKKYGSDSFIEYLDDRIQVHLEEPGIRQKFKSVNEGKYSIGYEDKDDNRHYITIEASSEKEAKSKLMKDAGDEVRILKSIELVDEGTCGYGEDGKVDPENTDKLKPAGPINEIESGDIVTYKDEDHTVMRIDDDGKIYIRPNEESAILGKKDTFWVKPEDLEEGNGGAKQDFTLNINNPGAESRALDDEVNKTGYSESLQESLRKKLRERLK